MRPPIPEPAIIELTDDEITEITTVPKAPALELVLRNTNPARLSGLIDGRYDVLGRCQEGGMGYVYRVLDRKLGRLVALKTWAVVDRKAEYRLREEFRRAYPARHNNLVRLFNLGRDPERDLPYFTMEFIDGVDFTKYVVREDASAGAMRADLSRLRDATRQLTLGTSALHRNGLLHRDLKPSNVMVDREGRVVILDFGLADAFNRRTETLRTTSGIEGTALYMAPEQAEGGALSPAVDYYAIGVMLFECVTGQLPFDGNVFEVITRKREYKARRASELVSDVPDDLDELIALLLRRDPQERATAAHLLAWCDGTRRQSFAASLAYAPTVQLPAMVLESRKLQIEALQIASERVRRLRPTAVFVHGPSGTGKTAMIESVLQGLARAPAPFVVLRGRCVEHETVPYRVFDSMINALARFLKGLPEDERAFLLEADVTHLLHVFPVLSRVPGLERNGVELAELKQRDAARHLAALEFRHLLYEVARRHLLAIHLDNLELGDRDSIPLLDTLLDGPDRPPLLLLGSFRSGAAHNDMLELIQSRLATREGERVYGIELGPLPHADSVRLAHHFLEPSVFGSEMHAAALVNSCNGDAFLIEQLARLVHRFQAKLVLQVEAYGTDALSWENVMRYVLTELSQEARTLLEITATSGSPTPLALLVHAAELEDPAHAHVDALQQLHLVRVEEGNQQLLLTIAHPLLCAAVLGQINDTRRRTLHTALANTHFEHNLGNEEAGARHLVALGMDNNAAEPFANAGYEALKALAFDRAALLYAKAVRCSPHNRVLRTRLADALAFAGHATEAGRHFLMVARASKKARRVELLTRGVEQLIYGGELAAASSTLSGLLAEVGDEYPSSEARAMLLLERALKQLTAHSLHFREHNTFELGSQQLAELGLYRAIGKALLPVDPVRGGYLIVRGALASLLAGEPRSVAHTLALVGLLIGGDNPRLADRFLTRAERVASQVCDRYAQGLASLSRGALAYHEASWLEALGQYDNAWELLRTQPQTTRWDRSMIEAGQRATLAASAEVPALNQQRGELDHTANLHDRLRHGFGEVVRLLAADQPDDARAHVNELLAREPAMTRDHARILAGPLTMLCDLYTGQVREDWSEFSRMLALQGERGREGVRDFRLDLTPTRILLGRVALARAVREHPSRSRLLKLVDTVVQALEKHESPALQGEAALLRAGLCNLTGDVTGAIDNLRRAAQRFLEAGTELHLACTWRRLGGLLANDEGDALIERAETVFAREGVHNARRWTQLYAPALSSAQSGRIPRRAA